MKQKINQTIKAIMLLLLMVIVSCEKEDLSMDHSNVNGKHELSFTFKAVTLNGQSLKQFSPTIGRRVDQLNAGTFQKSSNFNSTIIDTSYVKVLQSEEFDSYIFRVTDSTLTSNHYKNYVIVEIRDSIVNQYMVNYYLDAHRKINTALTTVEPVFGDDLLNQVQYKCGGSDISVSWVSGTTTDNACASGQHTVSDGSSCDYWGDPDKMATRSYTAGYWQVETIAAEPCSGGGGGGGSSGGGGGGSSGGSNNNPPSDNNADDPDNPNNNNEPVDIIGIGIVDNIPPIEIELPNKRKLKRISDQPNIKAKIQELRTKCVDPNQITEDGAQYIKNGSSYLERLPSYTGATRTRFDPDFVPGAEVVVHMHERQTYRRTANGPVLVNIAPVFSVGDIYAFMGLAEYNVFDNNNVTSILVSPAGAFAMRVDDMDALEDALVLLEPVGFDSNGNPIDS